MVFASCKFPLLDKWKALTDKNPVLGFIDCILTGYSQIIFNDNSFSGVLLLIALFLCSVKVGVSSLFCAVMAVCFARLIGTPVIMQRVGQASLGSSMIGMGIAVLAFPGPDITVMMLLVDVGCTIMTVLLTAALSSFLEKWQSPAFALPFCIVMAMMIPAVLTFSNSGSAPLVQPYVAAAAVAEGASWTFSEFVVAALNGFAEIIFQADTRSAIFIIVALLMASRVDAVMTVYITALSTLLAIWLGLPKGSIMIGVYGFNAIFTMLALFGRTFALSIRTFLYATFASLLTVFLYAGIGVLFAPMGAPVGALPFSLICILSIVGRGWFSKLRFVPPVRWGVPETIAKQLKAEAAEAADQETTKA